VSWAFLVDNGSFASWHGETLTVQVFLYPKKVYSQPHLSVLSGFHPSSPKSHICNPPTINCLIYPSLVLMTVLHDAAMGPTCHGGPGWLSSFSFFNGQCPPSHTPASPRPRLPVPHCIRAPPLLVASVDLSFPPSLTLLCALKKMPFEEKSRQATMEAPRRCLYSW
jgi:hypothetical protein